MASQPDLASSKDGVTKQTNGVAYTNGNSHYNVPAETLKVFQEGILGNPRIARFLPEEALSGQVPVHFTGSSDPSLPINWREAESVAALKALEATLVNVILNRKYNLDPQTVTINTDHAILFIFSCILWSIDPDGANVSLNGSLAPGTKGVDQHFPSGDTHRLFASLYRGVSSNLYRCADGKFFQLHSSLDPDGPLKSIDLPLDRDVGSYEEAIQIYMDAVGKIPSDELQHRTSDIYKHAGQVCLSSEEFWNSEHGKANQHVDLFEIHDIPNERQPACWWPATSQTSPSRPLAGLKVVDLTRIIAGPTIGRGLAELGASVMRVKAPHLPDYGVLHPDLNWGKWNCHIDLREEEGRERLRALILDADVVLNGYRPNVLAKYGFGEQQVIELCNSRERGIIYARENCYGWNGPWRNRSGWQQISDAVTGVAVSFGRALGLEEPVLPVFPNSDYCTGIAGICGVLIAIVRRGERGGSYLVDIALNYYNQWLIRSVGTYPDKVFEKMRREAPGEVYRHYHTTGYTYPRMLNSLLNGQCRERLFKAEFFEDRPADVAIGKGKVMRCVKPVISFDSGIVKPGYHIGTRRNGVDAPKWPEDLTVQQVA
ncbi:hypothetical protein AYO20_04219 [Fonsecaea nubica]|uniref:Uncharacterized protein n=1 Tax=Fonsecaea nubica TaxID=856822 RepID=A0A178D5Q3_9EURO|nr:hypothetical protein AYO20_04219 [Fonsecaea nubica]OAL36603.1 hypothetical protein AYO20_04219 [Fonsecaea nubica]